MEMIKRWLVCKKNYGIYALTVGKVYETHRIDVSFKYKDHKRNIDKGLYNGWHLGMYYVLDDNGKRVNIYVSGEGYKAMWKEIRREKLNHCTNPDPLFN
ncbi:hypothetical protein JDW20_19300 [Bacillus subtilis]